MKIIFVIASKVMFERVTLHAVSSREKDENRRWGDRRSDVKSTIPATAHTTGTNINPRVSLVARVGEFLTGRCFAPRCMSYLKSRALIGGALHERCMKVHCALLFSAAHRGGKSGRNQFSRQVQARMQSGVERATT
jgi:hypothetical protein